jgi:hypothetical protein
VKRGKPRPLATTRRVTLRPTGPGNWRPLVLEVVSFPREQGRLFNKDDGDLELIEPRDVWTINGREFRVAKVEGRKA